MFGGITFIVCWAHPSESEVQRTCTLDSFVRGHGGFKRPMGRALGQRMQLNAVTDSNCESTWITRRS